MTERAQRIMKAYEAEDTYNFPNDGVAAAIRAIVDDLQYDNGEWLPPDSMVVDVKDLLKLADELEAQ